MHPCKHGAKLFTRKNLARHATKEDMESFIRKMGWPETPMMYRRVRDSLKLTCEKLGFQANDLFHFNVSSGRNGKTSYRVILNGNNFPTCTCPDWQTRFSELVYKTKRAA